MAFMLGNKDNGDTVILIVPFHLILVGKQIMSLHLSRFFNNLLILSLILLLKTSIVIYINLDTTYDETENFEDKNEVMSTKTTEEGNYIL